MLKYLSTALCGFGVALFALALIVFAASFSTGLPVLGAVAITSTPSLPPAQFFPQDVPGTHARPGFSNPVPYSGNGWTPAGVPQP